MRLLSVPTIGLLVLLTGCASVQREVVIVVTATPAAVAAAPDAPSPAPTSAAVVTEAPPKPPAATATGAPAATGCVLSARFVSDVSIPDNTAIAAGGAFVKTWRVQNDGNCPWPAGLQAVYVSGASLSASGAQAVPPIAPGATTDISVNMTAPAAPGAYRTTWQLQAPDGARFGRTFWAQIVVPGGASSTQPPPASAAPTASPVPPAPAAPTATPVPPTPVPPTATPVPPAPAAVNAPLVFYQHQATAETLRGNQTVLSNDVLNGRSDLLLFVTSNYGDSGPYHTRPIGVWFDGSRWTIFNQDQRNMTPDARFNVVAFAPGSNAFVHTAAAGNIINNYTELDHPRLNGNPDARLLVTANWFGTYNPHAIGVFYTGARWAIFNQDLADMPAGAAFNVLIGGDAAFLNEVVAGDVPDNWFAIGYDRREAFVFVTQLWRGVYNNREVGVWYNSRAGWTIYNQDLQRMPSGARFFVLTYRMGTR